MTRKLASFLVVVVALSLAAIAQTPAAHAARAAAPAPAPAPATATPAGPVGTKIGIINIQAAIVATNEGTRDFNALEKKFEPKRAELQNAKAEIDKLQTQLNNQSATLNDPTRQSLTDSIASKQKVLQRNFEDAQADWTSQQNDIANRIGGKMMPIVEKYATQNGYAVILDVSEQQSPVLWASAGTNITKAVVDAYNAQSNVPAQPTPASAPKAPASRPAATASKH